MFRFVLFFSLANNLQNRIAKEVCFGLYSEFADYCRVTVKHYLALFCAGLHRQIL